MPFWLKDYCKTKNFEIQHMPNKSTIFPSICRKAGLDSSSLVRLEMALRRIDITNLTETTLIFYQFTSAAPSTVCLPLKSTNVLCLATSVQTYCSLLRCYVSLSSNYSFDLLISDFLPCVYMLLIFINIVSLFLICLFLV